MAESLSNKNVLPAIEALLVVAFQSVIDGKIDTVKSLLQVISPSTVVHYKNNEGKTLLDVAAQQGFKEIEEILLAYTFDVNVAI